MVAEQIDLAIVALLREQVLLDEEPVRIGVAVPLSGNNAPYGKDIENAVTLTVAEASASNLTIGGKPAKFVVKAGDDQADPRVGVQVARQVVDKGVAVVIH